MRNIAIVFYSGTGNTEAMAEAIAEGVNQAGAQAILIHAQAFSSAMLEEYDAIAFGCPARGVEELEEEFFEPMFSALEDTLKGKRVALFGSYGWGEGEWMKEWQGRTLALGAILVTEPIISLEEPDEETLEACKALGAELALKD
ncbi:MAG TPA: flavodoxin [Sphaerochaeta sp.]|nr:flavodoxin [Sphaerochaeta sp.]